MNKLIKFGYFCIGFSAGIFGASLMYQHELDKPIGDIEEYIIDEEETSDDSEENTGEFSYDAVVTSYGFNNSKVDELDIRAQQRRSKKNDAPAVNNRRVQYSRMYDDGQKITNDILKRKQAMADPDYEYSITDCPNDDEPSLDDFGGTDILEDDIVTERVEGNFEIYLSGEPEDFVTLIFYQGDNTLTDERDGIIPAANDVVGRAAIDRLIDGGPGAEGHTIFVKNLRTNIIYEVVLDAGSYSETVLGIFDSRHKKGAGGDVNRR